MAAFDLAELRLLNPALPSNRHEIHRDESDSHFQGGREGDSLRWDCTSLNEGLAQLYFKTATLIGCEGNTR